MDVAWEALRLVLSIMAGVVGGFASVRFLVKEEAKRRHLEEIKSLCLKPILKQLYELRREFSCWGELERSMGVEYLKREEPVVQHLTDFSFSADPMVERVLLDDLGNHFPRLCELLSRVEKRVAWEVCIEFLRLEHRIARLAYEHISSEVASFVRASAIDPAQAEQLMVDVVMAVLNRLFGCNEGYWPNLHRRLAKSGLIGVVERISEYLRKAYGKEVSEMCSLRVEGLRLINECIDEVRRCLRVQRLEGVCEFV